MREEVAAQREDADALKEFSRAVELNPKLPEAHYSAGKVHLQQGNLEEAEADGLHDQAESRQAHRHPSAQFTAFP